MDAKIFLANERGLYESSSLRRYTTFNDRDFYNEHKQPFHSLFSLNNISLAAGNSTEIETDRNAIHIFIPLRGALVLLHHNRTLEADVEEVLVLNAQKGVSFVIENKYEADWIGFLHLALASETATVEEKQNFSFVQKGLQSLKTDGSFKLSIGLFDGRQEALYALMPEHDKAFISVLSGAFEVNGCLLHEGDGLGLQGAEEIDMEALSNHAILLLVELGL